MKYAKVHEGLRVSRRRRKKKKAPDPSALKRGRKGSHDMSLLTSKLDGKSAYRLTLRREAPRGKYSL